MTADGQSSAIAQCESINAIHTKIVLTNDFNTCFCFVRNDIRAIYNVSPLLCLTNCTALKSVFS